MSADNNNYNRAQDQQAVETWQLQIDLFTQQIKQSSDNEELIKELKEMREDCYLKWAKKVVDIERGNSRAAPPPFIFGAMFENELNETVQKLELMDKAEKILGSRALRKGVSQQAKNIVAKHKKRHECFDDLKMRCKEIQEDWEENFKDDFMELEDKLGVIWKETLAAMDTGGAPGTGNALSDRIEQAILNNLIK
jgi:hypothetical protein